MVLERGITAAIENEFESEHEKVSRVRRPSPGAPRVGGVYDSRLQQLAGLNSLKFRS
jgi:hypothetical protein